MRNLLHPSALTAIRARLSTLTPADTPRWGRMTLLQMLNHLADSNAGAAGHRLLADPQNPIPLPRSIPNLPKPILTFFALNLPMRWPKNVPTVPAVHPDIGGTRPTTFAEDQARLLATFETLAAHSSPWLPHPYFGPLTRPQWMRWAYLHHDHHLRQFGR